MARSATLAVWSVVLVMTCMIYEAAADGETARVGIRLSEQVAIPHGAVTAARSVVAEVYRRAGVEVVWADSPLPADRGLQVTVVLTREAPVRSTKTPEVLGVAVPEGAAGGPTSYVIWPRVVEFARVEHVSASKILGRVIAHEVGHLLLGERAHSVRGIMRPHWTRADFASIDDRASFSSDQAARLRERIADIWKITPTRDVDGASRRVAEGRHRWLYAVLDVLTVQRDRQVDHRRDDLAAYGLSKSP